MDDVILNKIAIIERSLKRIRQEYLGHENELESNFTKQDSIILNLQRACEASIDLGMRIVRTQKLGVPQESREVFDLLFKEGILSERLCRSMQNMVGFRNLAVHDYQRLNLAIVHSILNKRLGDFKEYYEQIQKAARSPKNGD